MKEDDLNNVTEGPHHPPSPFLIVANKLLGGPVILNVGGKRHEVRWNTLDKFPTSRLGRLRHCVTHRGKVFRGLDMILQTCNPFLTVYDWRIICLVNLSE